MERWRIGIKPYQLYHPITATPFSKSEAYIEIPPCDALAPYIRCFWGTNGNIRQTASEKARTSLVIPDTCMDIILQADFARGGVHNAFCGIQDKSFFSSPPESSGCHCMFAIRFYAWSVILFADEDMTNVLNVYADTDCYFKAFKRELESALVDSVTIEERIEAAQDYLLRHLHKGRENPNVMNAVYRMIQAKGGIGLKSLADYTSVSPRHLERLFLRTVGISPNQLTHIIRYQNLWQEIICKPDFDVQDAVLKYGYCDQSHLLKNFKSYHTMTPLQAKKYALRII